MAFKSKATKCPLMILLKFKAAINPKDKNEPTDLDLRQRNNKYNPQS